MGGWAGEQSGRRVSNQEGGQAIRKEGKQSGSSDAGGSVQNPAPNREQPNRTASHRTDRCGAGSSQYNLFAVRVTVVFYESVRTAVHRFRTDFPIGCWDSLAMTFLQE